MIQKNSKQPTKVTSNTSLRLGITTFAVELDTWLKCSTLKAFWELFVCRASSFFTMVSCGALLNLVQVRIQHLRKAVKNEITLIWYAQKTLYVHIYNIIDTYFDTFELTIDTYRFTETVRSRHSKYYTSRASGFPSLNIWIRCR